MPKVASIGLDIAKNVFQAYGVDEGGNRVFNRKLRRGEVMEFFSALPPCLVGMEACSTSHHWAREIRGSGHDVRLIHTSYVKPFVKRDKTDANDAEAINEAVTRKTMSFVPIKSKVTQASFTQFQTRTLLVRQRAQSINAFRSHLAEFGIIARTGPANIAALVGIVRQDDDALPPEARSALALLIDHIEALSARISELETRLSAYGKADPTTSRLLTVPGVGSITAAAIVALVPDISAFSSSRRFASWIGLTPRSHSSGGKITLGSISKRGNTHLRSLLVMGAAAILARSKADDPRRTWINRLRQRKPFKVAAVALANKMARVIWALLSNGGTYISDRSLVES
jgi:transposase